MKRLLIAAAAVCGLAILSSASVLAAVPAKHSHHKFRASFTGQTVYFNPAGMEPDFDLINRVIIVTRVHTRDHVPLTLILDAYLESFQTDTQPVLPDLIHPKRLLSSNLGGFFSGKAIIVSKSDQVLYVGNMLAEALVAPICMYSQAKKPPKQCLSEEQHMVVAMYGEGPARGGFMNLRSWFLGNQKLQITAGKIYGSAVIPKKARKILRQGFGHPSINQWFGKYKNQILQDFHIPRPIMHGTAGSGSAQAGYCYGHTKLCTNRARASNPTGTTGGGTTSTGSSRPVWMAPLGGSLIGIAFILLAVYFWQERKRGPRTSGKRSAIDHP